MIKLKAHRLVRFFVLSNGNEGELRFPVIAEFNVAVCVAPGNLGVRERHGFHVLVWLVLWQEGGRGISTHLDYDGIFELDGEVLLFFASVRDAVEIKFYFDAFAFAACRIQLRSRDVLGFGDYERVVDALSGRQTGVVVARDFDFVVVCVYEHLVFLAAA